jgi:glutamyl-tRNA synthetase/glutamyl-Q tRNA(Asp) synthetase
MPPIDLTALAARLPPRPLTRFAPAPTGYLHLGHVVNAIHVWGLARALGGRVLLRIEDHDRTRCRPEYERAILGDLEWLGLEPDVGTPAELRAGPAPYRQSDSGAAYAEALDRLRAKAHVFACDCSRRDLAAALGDVANVETPYTGRCRDRGLEETRGRGIRLRLEPGAERFDDARVGPQCQEPARQCGDLLLRDRLGQWTYQFAVVVDDLRHGVSLVVRGEDLLDSTGRQLRLLRLLDGRAPVYLHHELIRKPDGAKLSKSDGDTGIRELRAAGRSPAEVLGRAARVAGLLAEERPISADDLPDLFERPGPR